jgi:archaetidylinositol phosphate synthase
VRYTKCAMLSVLKPFSEKALQPIAYPLRKVPPNYITLFGLIFPILFFIFLQHKWYIAALAVFILNAVDMLDGIIARSQHKVTAFGGFLDSTVDRFADFTILVAFGFAGIVSWNIVLPLVLLSYLISYIRSRTELAAKGTLIANVGIIERAERLAALFIGLCIYAIWPHLSLGGHNLMSLTFLILIVLSIYTVGQRIVFAYRNL